MIIKRLHKESCKNNKKGGVVTFLDQSGVLDQQLNIIILKNVDKYERKDVPHFIVFLISV